MKSIVMPVLVLWACFFVFYGCNVPDPSDDDTSAGDDDTGDDDTGADDATDICDGFQNETICDGDTAVFCDEYGDVSGTEDCDTANDYFCWFGLGCVMCYPGERWCDGNDVMECAPNGQQAGILETCDEAAGMVCEGGACVALCDLAEQQRSSIGCLFYGVDMEQNHDAPTEPYAVSVSNVHETVTAHVTVETKSGGIWTVTDQADVLPRDLGTFSFPNAEIPGTGLGTGYAYKVTSTIPVIAYQFNPLNGASSYTSDASLMLPASAYDTLYVVPGWGSQYGHGSVNVVAEVDGTQVWVTPSSATLSGGAIPAGTAGVQMAAVTLDEGDVLQISSDTNVTLEGTWVEASERVGVFAGNQCANIPTNCTACDHVEEQIFGIQTWGTEYLAMRLPPRVAGSPEEAIWHILAGDAPTSLTFQADASVTGLPPGNTLTLLAGESVELSVTGSSTNPGDFYVSGDEAFLVNQYMIGATCAGGQGDPCMVQSVPVEQFLDNYVVLVPTTWTLDMMAITRDIGSAVTIDGTAIEAMPSATTTNVLGLYEVVRFSVDDGTHVLEGDLPFGVMVVGYDSYDSYCYPGGLNQEIINDL